MGKILSLIEGKLLKDEREENKNKLKMFLEMEVNEYNGYTSISGSGANQHSHKFHIDQFQSGSTIRTIPIDGATSIDHVHQIFTNVIQPALDGHSHTFSSVEKREEKL